jgi:hypothetical protein
MLVRFALLFPLLLPIVGCSPAAPDKTTTNDAAPVVESSDKNAGDSAGNQTTLVAVTSEPDPDSPHNKLTQDEIDNGWILLFDGHSLFGWKPYSDANWAVKDDAITVSDGKPGLLCTTVQFANYELSIDFKAGAKTNSGVFLHTPPQVSADEVATKCYELNIAPPDNPFPTGSLVQRKKVDTVKPSDDWHTFHITVDGPSVRVDLDGELLNDYDDPNPTGRGYIGLQFNQGPVAFRNIKLKPLGLSDYLPYRTLKDWKPVEGSVDFKSEIKDGGDLNITGGKGALESPDQFGDLVLQMWCRTNAENLNGGVFFRCIPGEMMNGYESQIHNAYKDGDRTKPVDFGTGAIFRRVQARRVIPSDKEWFAKTIIADGPDLSVWVNGYQVTAWTDDRKPHDNPRNGLRLKPGTIQLQGHDPTTDLSFRNIRAAEWRAFEGDKGKRP